MGHIALPILADARDLSESSGSIRALQRLPGWLYGVTTPHCPQPEWLFTSVCRIRGLEIKSADFMMRTDCILIGLDFSNAPSLLLLDKRVQLLSTQAALASRSLTANPQYNTHIVLRSV